MNRIKYKWRFLMDSLFKVMPILFKLVENKKYSVNITKINNEIIVNIISPFKIRTFKDSDVSLINSKVKRYFKV
jgi:hypothetical protein